MMNFNQILEADHFDKQMLIRLLDCSPDEHLALLNKAEEIRLHTIGNKVFGRALIELSNICKKDCFYCGIRKSNTNVSRYNLELEDVKQAIDMAIESNIGSLAIQSGEQSSPKFVEQISEILSYIKSKDPHVGITLSCGEQPEVVYKEWFRLGAERYLLRIETSNESLYYQYHPKNQAHDFTKRLSCLQSLKDVGYQTGTGVMIGLPNQKLEDLANDIIFMRDFDIHMCGMGPFIPCVDTPLESSQPPFSNTYEMSIRMIAILRIVMKDINIVASTAMETIHPNGRTEAIRAGANVIMPNINPTTHRKKYALYNKKPTLSISSTEQIIAHCKAPLPLGYELGLGEKGNSTHWKNSIRTKA